MLTEKRAESVTAPQLLFFLNNPQVVALAGKTAARVRQTAAANAGEVTAAYRLVLGRTPSDREKARASAFVKANSLERFCHMLMASSEFNYLE